MTESQRSKYKVGFVSLGCAKNLCDTEVMLHHLMEAGYQITPEETEAEMRLMHANCGYVLDPHTAVATAVARRLRAARTGDDTPLVVAATATPYKFPETCARAFGENVLTTPPPAFAALETAPVTQTQVVDVAGIDDAVRALLKSR